MPANVIHLVGAAGTGMSALAEALLDCGEAVSGSDRFLDSSAPIPALQALRSQGVEFFPQDGSGIRPGITARVVASVAVEDDNPDLAATRRANIPSSRRADELARLFDGRRLVAVAGTSGKSTTTAMLGHLLRCCGMDPRVVNGAPCVNWMRPGRTGAVLAGNGPWVAEADESNRQFLAFSPAAAIILNESADHFPIAETHALFDEFASRVRGPVVDARGENPAHDVVEGEWSVSFSLDGMRIAVPLPGAYNAENASAACRMAIALGAARESLAPALATFRGLARRMQLVGRRADGLRAVDDYAHNTEKLRASLLALRKRSERLFAVWRPHGYGPLRAMWDDLLEMFTATLRPDDRLLLLPVFDAGGTADRSVRSEDFVAALASRGAPARFAATPGDAAAVVRAEARGRDIAATFGARDPGLPILAKSFIS